MLETELALAELKPALLLTPPTEPLLLAATPPPLHPCNNNDVMSAQPRHKDLTLTAFNKFARRIFMPISCLVHLSKRFSKGD